MPPTLELRDEVAILNLGDGENRFSPDWLGAVDALVDTAQRDAQALVTVGGAKFYSNGLDLDWLMANAGRHDQFVGEVHELYARLLTIGMPTVAAINGHAFGAGAMLAIAHDFRVMREDRGFFCFPEVDIDIPFTPGMAALVQAKLTPQAAIASMTTGRRFGGGDALAFGIVDATATQGALLDAAIARVAPLVGKTPSTLAAIKSTMYRAVTEALGG